jgi:hypothetical protein|tara:strand:- start:10689 stop:11465 length:777 start_codon:yes stop_codon:yes gene_type:complete
MAAKAKGATAPNNDWIVKDRLYELTRGKKPLVFTVPTAHSPTKSLLWFDKDQGYQRELRYATNQRSCFVDEQVGQVTMGRIVFRDGLLRVKGEDVVLQQLLSLYHPYTSEGIIEEYKPVQEAKNQSDWIEYELAALNLAKSLPIEESEAILRVEMGEKVNSLTSTELKRDVLVFARNQPQLFMSLAQDDNVQLRSFGAKAVESNILTLSPDQRTFTYGESGRKVMTVPFDEHPYSALAAFFKTDEGMEVYKAIEKRLK